MKKFFITIFLVSIHNIGAAHASTPWIPEEKGYFIGTGFSSAFSFSKDIVNESNKYRYLQQLITSLENNIENIRTNFVLPQNVRKQRIEAMSQKIESLKMRCEALKKQFMKESSKFYIEHSIYSDYSFGIAAEIGNSIDFDDRKSNFSNINIFSKKKLFQDQKWMISGELGLTIDKENEKTIYPGGRINMAYVKNYSSGRKLITEFMFFSSIGGLPTIASSASEALEFSSGYFIQLSSYYQYNRSANLGYRYYYKDQFSVAKKIRNDRIPALNSSILSLGLYQDYFYKDRKPGSKGIYCGVWISL